MDREDFARIIKTEKHGQILIQKSTCDVGNPCLMIKFEISVGHAEIKINMPDTDSGWDFLDSKFEGDEQDFIEVVGNAMEEMGET